MVATMIREDTTAVQQGGDVIEIIKHFNHLRIANDDIKSSREALQQIADSLSTVVIPDVVRVAKETTGLKTPINIEGVGRVTVSYRYSASILDHPLRGKEPGYEWLRANGAGEIIKPTVNAGTLSSYAKSMLEEKGEELPDDIFKVGTAPYTSITKAK
jgi:hypothetical protein